MPKRTPGLNLTTSYPILPIPTGIASAVFLNLTLKKPCHRDQCTVFSQTMQDYPQYGEYSKCKRGHVECGSGPTMKCTRSTAIPSTASQHLTIWRIQLPNPELTPAQGQCSDFHKPTSHSVRQLLLSVSSRPPVSFMGGQPQAEVVEWTENFPPILLYNIRLPFVMSGPPPSF